MPKPQSKTQKKIDNNIRLALTEACEQTLEDVPGFQWLTHQADYSNFPASLLVTCVFDTSESQLHAEKVGHALTLRKCIQTKLLKIGIPFKRLEQQVIFDSEEACLLTHGGDWTRRLGSRVGRAVAKNRPN